MALLKTAALLLGGAPRSRLVPLAVIGALLGLLAGAGTAGAANPGPSLSVHEPGTGGPASLQQAYDLTALAQTQGATTTVALVEIGNDSTVASDLAVYRSFSGLPPCGTSDGCLRVVGSGGGAPAPSPAGEDIGETSLDVDAVSALCPRCRLLVVQAEGHLAAAQATAVGLGATVISDSWVHQAEGGPYETYDFPGVATVASSGDRGFRTHSLDWEFAVPAALPNTTAAGGTVLQSARQSHLPSLRGYTETAWSESGSFCDPFIAKPAWQSDGGCPGRTVADLSADGGSPIGVYSGGAWIEEGGTSLSAPLVAAFYALTGAPAQNPSWAYESAAALNDIVGGSSGSCPAAYLCNAEPGYDGPTGVGSISGSAVRGAPGVARASMVNGTYTQSAVSSGGKDTFALEGGVYTNGLPTTYSWQYGRTVFEKETFPAVALPASCQISKVTGTLPNLTASGNWEYRLVAKNALGTSYGYTSVTPGPAAELPAAEPTLPATVPTACPTPSPLPDAPDPTPPVPAPKPAPVTPKPPPNPAPKRPPAHHGPGHFRVGHPRVRHGFVLFEARCPAAAAKGCVVKAIAKGEAAATRTTVRLQANYSTQVRLRLPGRLGKRRRFELDVLVREPPGHFRTAFQHYLGAG